MEFNAEFRRPEKAWLLAWDGDRDVSWHVSHEDVKEIIKQAEWLLAKFEAHTRSQGETK